jgi:predicted ribosomally synthesized peptide with nif11-like leader
MSTPETARFFAGLAKDEDLRNRYWESVERATVAATVEVAVSAGYAFTADDLLSELESQAAEMNDAELDAVAGGAEPLLAEGGRPNPLIRALLPAVRFGKPEFSR